jgi:hypothetical protein
MDLIEVVAPAASPRIILLDSLAHLDAAAARLAAALGYVAVGRYVNLHDGLDGFSLTVAELAAITSSVGCFPIQLARTNGWTAAAGDQDGRIAARNAIAAGLPPSGSLPLVCDLEGAIPSAHAAIDYAGHWWQGAFAEGWKRPALYVGAGVPLTAEQLFRSLPFRAYWRSFSDVPNVAHRGYQLLQLFPDDQEALGPGQGVFDLNAAQGDYEGERWSWVIDTAAAAA